MASGTCAICGTETNVAGVVRDIEWLRAGSRLTEQAQALWDQLPSSPEYISGPSANRKWIFDRILSV